MLVEVAPGYMYCHQSSLTWCQRGMFLLGLFFSISDLEGSDVEEKMLLAFDHKNVLE